MKTFKKIVLNNIGYKIVALALAFVLWAVVVNTNNPTMLQPVSGIPITIINEDAILDGSHVYKIESGETATIKISGTRSNVFAVLKPSAFKATADFSRVSYTGTVDVNVELKEEYAAYRNFITIEETSKMIISTDEIRTRILMVEVETEGTPAPGFEYDDLRVEPQEIEVTAPKEILDRLSRVVAHVDVTDAQADLDLAVKPVLYAYDGSVIELSKYVKLNEEQVYVSAGMTQYKEVAFKSTVIGSPFKGYEVTAVDILPASIKVKGSPLDLENFESIDLGIIDVSGESEDVSYTVDFLDLLPDNVTLADTGFVNAKVTIRIQPVQQVTESESTTENESEDE